MTLRQLSTKGKGCYLWHPETLGTPLQVLQALQEAHVDFVAVKVHNGSYPYLYVKPYVDTLRGAGIQVAAWGYVYLRWTPLAEANAAIRATKELGPFDFYLIDAEGHAKYQWAGAKIFAARLRSGMPVIPIGMNSYYNPMWHPELPWYALRSACDFDCPQVYWRGTDPVGKLRASKAAYARLVPRLPYTVVAGDMYYEFGLKPTPDQVEKFLAYADYDPEIQAAVMWSMDGRRNVPELWQAFSQYRWSTSVPFPPVPPAPPPIEPALFTAVTTGNLWVHSSPDALASTRIDVLVTGRRVDVYATSGIWANISPWGEPARWCSLNYLKKL